MNPLNARSAMLSASHGFRTVPRLRLALPPYGHGPPPPQPGAGSESSESVRLCEACAAAAVAAFRVSSRVARQKLRSRHQACRACRISAEELGLPKAVARALDLVGPDEDLLIAGCTGACVRRRGDSFVEQEDGLAGVEPGSVGHVASAEMLPTPDIAPAQLLSWVRQAVQALRDGGTLLLTSFWSPGGPLKPLLTLPELRLEVCVRPPDEDNGPVWTYICTRLSSPSTLPCRAMQVLLEAGPPALKAWAPNPEEALFEYNEIFCSRCYGPSPLEAPAWAGLPLARLEEGRPQPFVVVDAGMNLGVFELYLQQLAAVPVTSLAFEPAPDVFQLAVQTCREAGIHVVEHYEMPAGPLQLRDKPGLQVHAFQMALSDMPGTLGFTHFPDSPANSALNRHAPRDRWREGCVPDSVEFQVPCCRLSQALLALDAPTGAAVFLKGDVEGAEVDLLKGLDDEHWAWICGLAVEAAESRHELMELCRKHGFGEKLLEQKQPSPDGDTSRTDTEALHMIFAARD
ncbi:sdnD [Symbiodinium natans]|uniref:SdnD protein n=1 Tax=Symbiodinium natans TaxID=878477 RepID=A0A812S478_9DINO|nr:sdnD [Symbiodinium natans]